jgi:hypothetical protein
VQTISSPSIAGSIKTTAEKRHSFHFFKKCFTIISSTLFRATRPNFYVVFGKATHGGQTQVKQVLPQAPTAHPQAQPVLPQAQPALPQASPVLPQDTPHRSFPNSPAVPQASPALSQASPALAQASLSLTLSKASPAHSQARSLLAHVEKISRRCSSQ